jgi:tetratricopeptide (TPR) repeat protein
MSLRTTALLGAALSLTLCASAAWPDAKDDLNAARAIERDIDRGEKDWARAQTFKNKSSQLDVLDQSIFKLKRARSFAARHDGIEFLRLQNDAEFGLVRALDDQAEIYYARSSYPKAAKKVGQALEIDPTNPRSLRIAAKIEAAQLSNPYQGGQASRMRDRRPLDGPITPSGGSLRLR